MRGDEILVGGLSIVMALAAMGAALGPWSEPYKLWAARTIKNRFDRAALGRVWVN